MKYVCKNKTIRNVAFSAVTEALVVWVCLLTARCVCGVLAAVTMHALID